MSKWFVLNVMLFIFVISNLVIHPLFPAMPLSIVFGFLGFIFFLFNWTRHAVFSTIRDVPNRKTKIKFANLSKKVLPFHKWVGTSALIIIIIHAGFVIYKYGFPWYYGKFLTGVIALIILAGIVTTGWMRLFRPTITKRMLHIYFGVSLFWLIVIHVWL